MRKEEKQSGRSDPHLTPPASASSKWEPDGCVLLSADVVGPLGLKGRLTAAVPRGSARVTPIFTLQQNQRPLSISFHSIWPFLMKLRSNYGATR